MAYNKNGVLAEGGLFLDNISVWKYTSVEDTLSTIESSGYFVPSTDETDNLANLFKVGDFIYIKGTDGSELAYINSLDPITIIDVSIITATLDDGKIWIGNALNQPAAQTLSGDVSVTNGGVTSIGTGVIVNADVNASAAIAHSKLAALPSANILVGSALNVPTGVAVTGDISLSNTGVSAIASDVIVNADVNSAAAIDYSKLAPLTSAQILVGSAGNVATAVAMSGDVTISNTGVTSIAADSIVNADINSAAAIDFSKLAALPSAQVLVGSAGNVATAVAVTGDVGISNTGVTSITADSIVNADVNSAAAIAYSKLAPLTSAQVLVGSAGNVATAVDMTGDITISNTGVTAIGANVITNADINGGAAISFAKLENLPSSQILVGNVGNVASAVAMSGDITIDNAGVTSIVAGSVVNADINAAAAIDFSKLAPLTSAQVLVGSAGNVATSVAVTGDIAIDNLGVTSISAGSIVNADVNAAAAIDFSKLATLSSANILVGSAGNVATSVAMSGDVTINNAGVTSLAAGAIVNADVNAAAAIDFSKLATLSSGNILVGNVGNVATSVAMSGDVTIDNGGVTSIAAGSIVNADVNGAAAIAHSKLAAMPMGTILVGSAAMVPTAVGVTGDIGLSDTGVASISAGAIVNADVNATAAIDFSKLASLTSANILVGSAGNVATSVAMSGDVTIDNVGATSIAAGAIVNADVNAAAAIDFSKLATLTSGNLLVGSAGNVATSVAMSGDATMVASGALTIANNAVTNAKILNGTITGAKLLPAKGYFTVAVQTSETTPVNVFGVGGAPCALTVKNVFLTALDADAGNIILKQAANTVCTIAKGTSASAMVGATSLANTVYATSDVCTVESSSTGDALVTIVFEVA